MPEIEWSDKFSVGNEEIDNQHKKWIEIYNKAHCRMMEYDKVVDKRSIGKDALKEMIEYTRFHFDFEEKFLAKIGFIEIAEHKDHHRDFVRKLDRFALQIHEGVFILNSEIIKVIENWLVYHILSEDQKYADYIRDNG